MLLNEAETNGVATAPAKVPTTANGRLDANTLDAHPIKKPLYPSNPFFNLFSSRPSNFEVPTEVPAPNVAKRANMGSASAKLARITFPDLGELRKMTCPMEREVISTSGACKITDGNDCLLLSSLFEFEVEKQAEPR